MTTQTDHGTCATCTTPLLLRRICPDCFRRALDMDGLRAANARLSAQLAQTPLGGLYWEGEARKAKAEVERLRAMCETDHAEIVSLKIERQQTRAEIERLRQYNAALCEDAHQATDRHQEEIDRLRAEAQAEADGEKERELWQAFQSVQAEAQRLREKVEQIQEDCEARIVEVRDEATQTAIAYEVQLNRLRDEVDAMEAERNALQSELTAYRAERRGYSLLGKLVYSMPVGGILRHTHDPQYPWAVNIEGRNGIADVTPEEALSKHQSTFEQDAAHTPTQADDARQVFGHRDEGVINMPMHAVAMDAPE